MKLFVLFYIFSAFLFDITTTRIPNRLIVAGFAVSALCNLYQGGPAATAQTCLAAAALFVILFPLFLFRMTGAGDIKILLVLFLFTKGSGFFRILFGTLMFGGVLSVFILLADGAFTDRFRYFGSYIQRVLCTRKALPYRQEGGGGEFHLTVPMLMSMILWTGGLL